MRGIVISVVALCAAIVPAALAQEPLTNMDRGRAEIMLQQVRDSILDHYYDKTFHGIDVNARYAQYKTRIDSAKNLQEALRIIAGFAIGMNDSHTFFEPPGLTTREEYGYRMQIIGERCFITELRPGTDAATKLHIGDEVVLLNGYKVNRQDLWQLEYSMNLLSPVSATRFQIRTPAGELKELTVDSLQYQRKHLKDLTFDMGDTDLINMELNQQRMTQIMRQRYVEIGDVFIWKMPEFFLTDADLQKMVGIARHHKSVILDLRDNPGGSIEVLEHLVGSFFEHEVQISQPIGRKDLKAMVAKPRSQVFTGDLVVLVDSASGSCAELFARTIQLNHRGTVIGDRSAGKVMESRLYPLQQGTNIVLFYAMSVTEADLIMADGQSLENHGVTPDEIVAPTAQELADGKDPVLARAAEKLGAALEPKTAGQIFVFEWAPLDANH